MSNIITIHHVIAKKKLKKNQSISDIKSNTISEQHSNSQNSNEYNSEENSQSIKDNNTYQDYESYESSEAQSQNQKNHLKNSENKVNKNEQSSQQKSESGNLEQSSYEEVSESEEQSVSVRSNTVNSENGENLKSDSEDDEGSVEEQTQKKNNAFLKKESAQSIDQVEYQTERVSKLLKKNIGILQEKNSFGKLSEELEIEISQLKKILQEKEELINLQDIQIFELRPNKFDLETSKADIIKKDFESLQEKNNFEKIIEDLKIENFDLKKNLSKQEDILKLKDLELENLRPGILDASNSSLLKMNENLRKEVSLLHEKVELKNNELDLIKKDMKNPEQFKLDDNNDSSILKENNCLKNEIFEIKNKLNEKEIFLNKKDFEIIDLKNEIERRNNLWEIKKDSEVLNKKIQENNEKTTKYKENDKEGTINLSSSKDYTPLNKKDVKFTDANMDFSTIPQNNNNPDQKNVLQTSNDESMLFQRTISSFKNKDTFDKNSLETELTKKNLEIGNLSRSLLEQRKFMDNFNISLKEKANEVTKYKNIVDSKTKEFEELSSKFEIVKEEILNMYEENESLQETIDTLNDEVAEISKMKDIFLEDLKQVKNQNGKVIELIFNFGNPELIESLDTTLKQTFM